MKITEVKTFIADGVVRPWTIVKIETGTKKPWSNSDQGF
jgi:hypothetical protein